MGSWIANDDHALDIPPFLQGGRDRDHHGVACRSGAEVAPYLDGVLWILNSILGRVNVVPARG